jgi:hypothetical protein
MCLHTADLVYDAFGPIQPPNRWVPWTDIKKIKMDGA